MQKDAFYTVHPALNMGFFAAVILITAFVLHPVLTGISLLCAFGYAVFLKGRGAVKFALAAVLPVMLLVAIINPLFNHAGTSVLFFFKNGNPVTLEAVLYGIVSSAMFGALLLWFSCLNVVMTSDKYVFLFGRVIPALSLVFPMALRFVPRFTRRIQLVSEAQRSLSPEPGKSLKKAVKHGLAVLSMTTTWALESAVGISDSMKSRGYGLRGRTSFAIYRFERRDALLCAVACVCFGVSLYSVAAKHLSFRFYPSIKYPAVGAWGAAGAVAFAALCALPLLLNLEESIKWRFLNCKS